MKQPKTTLYCLGLAMALWGGALVAHAVTTTDFSRYQGILDRKPFGEVAPIAGAGTTEVAAAESFVMDYEMKGIIDDGEKLQVCVLNKKTNKHLYLDVGQEIYGMQLVSVNYDKEEAVLKIGSETTVIKLHPNIDKDKGAAPAVAGAAGLPAFVIPQKIPDAENTASPFNLNNQGNRRPFFSDMKRRGVSPFQRMGTNMPFQAKSLESFFKPNTNATKPFISPFRPQSSPFKPADVPGAAGQDGGAAAAAPPVDQPASLNPQVQAIPDQGYTQTPIQPVVMPFIEPVEDGGTSEIEE